ncbi:MAG: hypothetical protein UIT84_11390 [Lachnospiraceae bacterium]
MKKRFILLAAILAVLLFCGAIFKAALLTTGENGRPLFCECQRMKVISDAKIKGLPL